MANDAEDVGGLILAAEECDPSDFEKIHRFSKYDNSIIRSLIAHGPVLVRGGRGSGKSALLIEANNRIKKSHENVFSVYLSLRYLPLLRSSGDAYETIFCQRLAEAISQGLETERLMPLEVSNNPKVGELQQALVKLSGVLRKRIVLFFDDAAHIGRETSLAEFFDIFRTLSSSTISCKAAIYPGVTKFGTRFDVYNDATVIDIARDERMPGFGVFFEEVIRARYPRLLENRSAVLQADNVFPWFLGRAVAGNMRALVFACNRLTEFNDKKIDLDSLTKCLVYLASDYYWPLLEELTPKLGIYESLIEPSKELAEKLFLHVTGGKDAKNVANSVLVHRDLVQKYAKLFEILEYTGFISRREVSRAMKSGGRGTRYILNLCNLLEQTSGSRLTSTLFDAWQKSDSYSEIHKNSNVIDMSLPELPKDKELGVLSLEIDKLKKSKVYPYGLTDDKISRLKNSEFALNTIGELADANEEQLRTIVGIGDSWSHRIHNVVAQAIWM